jgi:hypothetical protein
LNAAFLHDQQMSLSSAANTGFAEQDVYDNPESLSKPKQSKIILEWMKNQDMSGTVIFCNLAL